jgi:Fe-S-cluster-containing hydrogenase component 2
VAPGSCAGSPLSSCLTPEEALAAGRWVKLICGASNQDLAAIEDICGIFSLAGVHCIDGAVDHAVVAAIRRGIAWAEARGASRPWLMLSLSDGDDPHFRKAWFDPACCPPACSRPCERICPALAIGMAAAGRAGVLEERCYGCGRCLPACPYGLIEERSQVLAGADVPPLLAQLRPDAVELHTHPGRAEAFAERVGQVRASGVPLQRLAVSTGLEGTAQSPAALVRELWLRFTLLRAGGFRPLWQLDGRPMSGDVGAGTARAAVKLAAAVLAQAPPGPVQLAGGTNAHTLPQLAGYSLKRHIAGVAFGGVARRLLQPLLLEAQGRRRSLLTDAELWPRALGLARDLVDPWLERI